MSMRTLLIGLAVLVFIFGGINVYIALNPDKTVKSERAILDVETASNQFPGFRALADSPPLPAVEIFDENTNPTSLAPYYGKVIVLNLWATWCPPCIREMPDLHALHVQYQDQGLAVVPVASGKQGKEEPAAFLRQRGMTAFKTLYDPQSQYLRAFDLETLPVTFIIDRKGRMRGGVIGMVAWQSDEAKALIEAFLSEP